MGGNFKRHRAELVSHDEADRVAQAWGRPSPESIVRRLLASQHADKIEPGDYRRFHNLKLATSVSNAALVLGGGNFYAT